MPKKNNITFAKPEEPAFIRKLKEQVGYKEGPTISDKTRKQEEDDQPDHDHTDPEDEKPTVVVLKDGDLTAEEADEIQRDLDLDDKTPGKFQFRKPVNKSSKGLTSSTKRARDQVETSPLKSEPTKKPKSQPKKSLLSFDDEEEEN